MQEVQNLKRVYKTNKVLLKTSAGLALFLNKFAEATETNVNILVKTAAFQFFEKVISMTPVDKGFARYNFQIDTKTNDEEKRLSHVNTVEYDTAPPFGINTDPEPPSENLNGPIYWVFNNVEYLIYLEHGSSDQAPRGMIRIALQQVTTETVLLMKQHGMI